MEQIQTIDRKTARELNTEINELVKAHLAKRGIEVTPGSCSYSDTELSIKLTCSVKGAETKLTAAYNLYKQPHWPAIGETVTSPTGKQFIIEGYDTKKRKYPIIGTLVSTGTQYKLGTDVFDHLR